MSNSNDLTIPEVNITQTDQKEQEIVIEFGNLTGNQKTILFVTVLSFVVQILYLTNLQIVTGLFKPFIAQSYNIVADYIVQFLDTFTPYLVVVYFGILVVSVYEVLVNDHKDLGILAELFDYSAMGSIIFVVFFFIAIFSIPTLPPNAFYPNVVEFVLFLFVLFLSVTIALTPFGAYKYLIKEDKSN